MKSQIIIVGASNLDRICRLDSTMASGVSIPGRVNEFPGGAGLNVASNLAALDVPVVFATVLGTDTAADGLRKAMRDRDIDVRIQSAEAASASYTAILQPSGELAVAVNDMGIYGQFDVATFHGELAGLKAADWLLVDANLEQNTLGQLSQSDCQFAALTVSTAKASRLRDLGNRLDLIFTNRREALALLDENIEGRMDRAVRGLNELGTKRVVISDGANPVAVLDGETCNMITVPDLPAIQDVTGAGDALAAGTLWRLMAGEGLCEAVRTGIAAAQAILQVDGPWREDLTNALSEMKAIRLD